MTTATAQLIVPTPTKSRLWKNLFRRALESLGKHYSHGPYML